jgi:hypothetical protein
VLIGVYLSAEYSAKEWVGVLQDKVAGPDAQAKRNILRNAGKCTGQFFQVVAWLDSWFMTTETTWLNGSTLKRGGPPEGK